jgi:hypothetical protein
VGPARDNS